MVLIFKITVVMKKNNDSSDFCKIYDTRYLIMKFK